MSARNKLNVAHTNGCLVIATFVGMMAQSWAVFLLALAVLVAGGIAGGDIRIRPRGQ